jgi:DNA-binding NarL/FixJ family response regulator
MPRWQCWTRTYRESTLELWIKTVNRKSGYCSNRSGTGIPPPSSSWLRRRHRVWSTWPIGWSATAKKPKILSRRLFCGCTGHWTALETLSARQRAVFVLRHHEGLALKEIADLLQLEEGTIKAHLHRAVRALRAELEDLYEDRS